VNAQITSDMTGRAPQQVPLLSRLVGRGTAQRITRSAVTCGRQLGGSGDVPESLVTLQQNPVNSPIMRSFENLVRSAVEAGEVVDYTATPIYNSTNLAPRAVTLIGQGSNGFNLGVSILNPIGF
jgi:hypothetical protein